MCRLLKQPLLAWSGSGMSSGRGGGGGSTGTIGTDRHSAGRWCTVQDGPVRFSNSNSIAAIKEQPGQSRRGKAGTICWWRRRESWEWIGPTVTAESQWPGAVAGLHSAGCVGAATGRRVILLCFLPCTQVQYTTVLTGLTGLTGHCPQAGKDLDRRPVGRPEQSVNPSTDKTRQKTVGRYSSSASAVCVRVPGLPPHLQL